MKAVGVFIASQEENVLSSYRLPPSMLSLSPLFLFLTHDDEQMNTKKKIKKNKSRANSCINNSIGIINRSIYLLANNNSISYYYYFESTKYLNLKI